MTETTDRFSDAGWFGYPVDIIIGGAGGIGSWVTLLVSRLGYNSFIYDFDHVELHNIGTQFYSPSQNNMNKAECVAVNSKHFGGKNVVTFNTPYNETSMVSSVMISGFDNMSSRREFFEKWKNHIKTVEDPEQVKLFIDGRMTAETGQIYFVRSKKDIELYESTLFSDSEVEDGPCSYKATPHNGPLIASIMVSGLVSAVYNKSVGMEIRNVPFMTEFRIPEFFFGSKTTKEYYHGISKNVF